MRPLPTMRYNKNRLYNALGMPNPVSVRNNLIFSYEHAEIHTVPHRAQSSASIIIGVHPDGRAACLYPQAGITHQCSHRRKMVAAGGNAHRGKGDIIIVIIHRRDLKCHRNGAGGVGVAQKKAALGIAADVAREQIGCSVGGHGHGFPDLQKPLGAYLHRVLRAVQAPDIKVGGSNIYGVPCAGKITDIKISSRNRDQAGWRKNKIALLIRGNRHHIPVMTPVYGGFEVFRATIENKKIHLYSILSRSWSGSAAGKAA